MADDNTMTLLDTIAPSDWVTSDNIIKVMGVGGGGCNAVNYMYNKGIKGCSFVVCNTDSQALRCSSVPVQIQMGRGLGAGTNPVNGRNAALESQEQIEKIVLDNNTKMLFITAGMGGGTGTGAAPVIAKMAKDKGILTVAVVTLPFLNEGNEALSRAIDGVHELEKNVDSLLIINNEKLHEYFGNQLIQDAFPQADEVLSTAVRGIVEIIKKSGYINVDFKDVETMMRNSGMALMGCGVGSGKDRIDQAVRSAFESPLLNDFDLKSAKKVLVNITCAHNDQGLTMDDLNLINTKISEYTGRANNFKRGLIWDDDPELGDTVRITSIVTGLRFSDVIGKTRDMGNYIMINKDFKYDKTEIAQTEGISLMADSCSQQIGFNTKSNVRKFKFEPDQKPILILDKGDNISELENIPAIRRIQK
ncbi:MAG TPA: cell division protein FtsZ [Rikenellaceae bacterium]|nr:cell division protein FtsZ [Rikenellaceae bacterium]